MRRSRISAARAISAAVLALSFFSFPAVNAQTSCGIEHPSSGVFICYPNPSGNDAASTVPDLFHFSAQANAPEGQAISGYTISVDKRTIYQIQLPAPIPQLSIETNLRSPFASGVHALQLVVRGVGTAETRVQFRHAESASLCDPFSRTFPQTCIVLNRRGPLLWSRKDTGTSLINGPVELYSTYSRLYNQNLKNIEADAADAVAVDRRGNLYVASHLFSGVDFRKYSPNGGVLYSSVIPMCGDALLSVAGVAIDDAGRAWIAGNSNGCLSTTPETNPISRRNTGRMRGFVMVVDTNHQGSGRPVYMMNLSDLHNRIAAIRVGPEGTAYIAGNTSSADFPHDTSLTVATRSSQTRELGFGFVAELDSSHPAPLWTTLLPNIVVTALAVDENANVFITGHTASRRPSSGASARSVKTGNCDQSAANCTDVVVAELSDRGRRVSFAASFGGSGEEEGRAISTGAHGKWIFVTGETSSVDFPGIAKPNSQTTDALNPFWTALQPCGTVALYTQGLTNADLNAAPEIAQNSALDAFAGEVDVSALEHNDGGKASPAFVHTAPTCSAAVQ